MVVSATCLTLRPARAPEGGTPASGNLAEQACGVLITAPFSASATVATAPCRGLRVQLKEGEMFEKLPELLLWFVTAPGVC